MVSSMTKKTFSLAISLLVVVISLTGVALGAGAPTSVTSPTRFTPDFAGAPGKMARDVAGNLYVADFWGKGIVKLSRQGAKLGFIATDGRPTAVAAMRDGRLVVAMAAPQPRVAFYRQLITATNVSGEEIAAFGGETPYRPVAVTTDNSVNEYIYVLDAGDSSISATVNVPKIRVYSAAGAFLYAIGVRTNYNVTASTITSASDARMKQPAGIAFEKVGNKIYVADTLNGRLLIFTAFNGTAMTLVPTTPGPGSFIGRTAGTTPPSIGSTPVTFGNPVDIAFEYNAGETALSRIYVAEKGRNEISVLDADTSKSTMYINGTTVANASLKQPNGVLFEKTATGGLLYVGSAATAADANNVLRLAIEGGSVSAGPALAIDPLLPTSPLTITLSGTGEAGYAVKCSTNGGAYVDATGTATWSIASFTLAAGLNNITCTNGSFAQASTSTDVAQSITVAIVQPGDGIITKNGSVTVSGTTSLPNATVQLVNSLNSYTVTTTSNGASAWSASVNLVAGSNLITASAWKTGTVVAQDTVTVTADYTLPTIAAAFLANSATTTDAVQNIDGIVTEVNLDSIEVNGVVVPASAKVSLAADKTYFSAPVTLVRGSNPVEVKVKDLAGNIATFSRTVTLNPEIPGFAVALPADGSYLPGAASVSVNGTAGTGFTLVNAYDAASGSWSGSLSAALGFNEYQFTATGGGNTAVSAKRSINAAAANAQLAITTPATDLATKNNSIVIYGNVAANIFDDLTIAASGGATITNPSYVKATGLFNYTVTFPAEGAYNVKVTAGSTTAVRNIIYDSTKPELTLRADSRPMPTLITGAIEPSAKIAAISATLNSSPISIPVSLVSFDSVSSGSVVWHANLSAYPFDANSLKITTEDPAGNTKQLSYTNYIPTGDVDGDGVVRLSDALAALRHVAGTQVLEGEPFKQADVGALVEGYAGQDGEVDIVDSYLILGKSYGLMTF